MKQRIKIDKVTPNTGALDYSWLLDAPAGKHGFVRNKDGHLYFEDGTRARFLGFNVATRSNTPDHATAEKLAERFASLGVNVIRLHAADAPIGLAEEPENKWSSCREAPLLDYESGSSRRFHPEGLDRFDYFAAKLKEKGIYLHIDLLVARAFVEGDELDYAGGVDSCTKCFPMINERLFELQKEYAKELLCHVNPYTGLALIDDPAVITIQMNNEDSAIKGTEDVKNLETVKPYRAELQRKFNHFLLTKYDNRENLAKAWTFEGVCALGEEEDPKEHTVRIAEGSFLQPVNDPMDAWDAPCGPARYADYMEFGIYMNRKFYRTFKNYLISLGAKVPIVASNLLGGAADVYGHSDGDIMENNSYFNHPLLPFSNNTYMAAGPSEYVSVDPLTVQTGIGAAATTLVGLGATAVIEGKPFMLSEWNEYGLHPFHSTAYMHTVAYACLNDWDGLILYNHHTSEKPDDQPDDEILNVFDAYNDPAVVNQWGFLAAVFLKGLVAPSDIKVNVVYNRDDLMTLPKCHMMPNQFFTYVTGMRNTFLDGGDFYAGDADVAVNAGFVQDVDLSAAAHAIYYAWSPYRDAMRKYKDEMRLEKAAAGTSRIGPGVHLGKRALVIDEIRKVAGSGNYQAFAALADRALKQWGVIEEDAGLVDGKLISATKEIVFDPQHSVFAVNTPYCGYFSGAPEESVRLSETVSVQAKNERMTLALLPKRGGRLDMAGEYVLTAMGNTGMDETTYTPGMEMMGVTFTNVALHGKLYADTLEGTICVRADAAVLTALDTYGNPIRKIVGERTEDGVVFVLDGNVPSVNYVITVGEAV